MSTVAKIKNLAALTSQVVFAVTALCYADSGQGKIIFHRVGRFNLCKALCYLYRRG
jgi:hypothetical protein